MLEAADVNFKVDVNMLTGNNSSSEKFRNARENPFSGVSNKVIAKPVERTFEGRSNYKTEPAGYRSPSPKS